MPGTLYGFPFNPEIFSYNWKNEPDPVSTAMIDSGAVQPNGEIANLVNNGSDVYTVPFYKVIGGTPINYDGNTDITATETEGAYQQGIVYGRAQAWAERDFVVDFNRADPMGQIVSQVARFWSKQRQAKLVSILNACFGVSAPEGYSGTWYTDFAQKHIMDISSASTTVASSNKLGATTIGDCIANACGDLAAGAFNLAIMHSQVAKGLAGLQLLEYRRYTDPMGIERQLPIADINGMTVIISDLCPVVAATESKAAQYKTFVLGNGAIQYAPANVEVPAEVTRDAMAKGGKNFLVTRVRETMLPNGFSYTKQAGDGPSPTDLQLGTSSRYSLIYDPKNIAMAEIISNVE